MEGVEFAGRATGHADAGLHRIGHKAKVHVLGREILPGVDDGNHRAPELFVDETRALGPCPLQRAFNAPVLLLASQRHLRTSPWTAAGAATKPYVMESHNR